MKTILIPITTNFFRRNFLQTDAFRILKENPDMRIVFLSPPGRLEHYKAEFGAENVVFDVLPPTLRLRIERFFKFVEISSIHMKTQAMQQESEFHKIGSQTHYPVRLAIYIFKRILWYLGKFRLYRSLIRKLYFLIRSSTYQEIFKKYAPDLVFVPTMIHPDQRILKEAKKSGIATAGMVLSWDNLYSKANLRVHPDLLIVQTEKLRDIAEVVGDYPKEKVIVSGVPQYDTYFKGPHLDSREDFLRKLGADPLKKTLLYAFSGKAGINIDFDILNILFELMREGKIPQLNIILRPYPKYDFPTHKLDILKAKYGFFGESSMLHVGKGSDNWEFDRESLSLLANSLAHSDIVVNMYSTFFIEAAIFGKPLIGIAFDGNLSLDYWNSSARFFEWDHLKEITPTGGIWQVKNKAELVEAVNAYLLDPKLREKGRRKMVEEQCAFTDGFSGRRIAVALLSMLK